MNPAALYIVGICFAGGLVACAAFAWAAWHGELTDASEAAFLVFDDDDAPAPLPGAARKREPDAGEAEP